MACRPGFDRYVGTFAAHAIGADVLADYDADLQKLGIPLGDRKRLLKAIAAQRQRDQELPRPAPLATRLDRPNAVSSR